MRGRLSRELDGVGEQVRWIQGRSFQAERRARVKALVEECACDSVWGPVWLEQYGGEIQWQEVRSKEGARRNCRLCRPLQGTEQRMLQYDLS